MFSNLNSSVAGTRTITEAANTIGDADSNQTNSMELDGLPSIVVTTPAVTLTFDLLIQKGNQQIKYICDQNWVKFPSLVY